jgi:hypothetical protein
MNVKIYVISISRVKRQLVVSNYGGTNCVSKEDERTFKTIYSED